VRRNRAEVVEESRKKGKKRANGRGAVVADGVRQKKKFSRFPLKRLPSPALLARRVETVAVLVMRRQVLLLRGKLSEKRGRGSRERGAERESERPFFAFFDARRLRAARRDFVRLLPSPLSQKKRRHSLRKNKNKKEMADPDYSPASSQALSPVLAGVLAYVMTACAR
jgi:hypothetical protein